MIEIETWDLYLEGFPRPKIIVIIKMNDLIVYVYKFEKKSVLTLYNSKKKNVCLKIEEK